MGLCLGLLAVLHPPPLAPPLPPTPPPSPGHPESAPLWRPHQARRVSTPHCLALPARPFTTGSCHSLLTLAPTTVAPPTSLCVWTCPLRRTGAVALISGPPGTPVPPSPFGPGPAGTRRCARCATSFLPRGSAPSAPPAVLTWPGPSPPADRHSPRSNFSLLDAYYS